MIGNRLLQTAAISVVALTAACGPELRDDASSGAEHAAPAQIELCTEPGAARSCAVDDAEGRQFCDYNEHAADDVWGPCLLTEACDLGAEDDCGWCSLDGGVPTWQDACGFPGGDNTPLVVVFGDTLVDYSPVGAASFDTFDGQCTSHDWPTITTPWLAMDRDGSGAIENGRELFGSGTRLRSGERARNGFEALAELDEDGDGAITAADPGYERLLVWMDTDGDRQSRPGELLPVSSFGLDRMELSYDRQRRCDARGNCELEHAAASTHADLAARLVDVHLACR